MSNGHPVRPQALSLFSGAQLQSIPQLPALRGGPVARHERKCWGSLPARDGYE